MDERTMHHRYLINFIVVGVLAALLAALASYLIDPYGLFGIPRTPGFNDLKPASSERVRVVKPYQAERIAPRVVIGGNSRPELGIDPQSPCWAQDEQPVFNAGIPGASFRLQTLYARHAVGRGDGRRIFMGVDFVDFLIDTTRARSREDAPRFLSADELRLDPRLTGADDFAHFRQRAADRLTALFSLTTFADALATVVAQRDPYAATRDENGFNPARDFFATVRTEGQWVLFEQKNREVAAMLHRPHLGLRDAHGQLAPAFAALTDFLAWAEAERIFVTLFINPYHVDYLRLIYQAGLWPVLEDWKRNLVEIAETRQIPLWDFHTIDEYSTETPPARGDTETMLRWYAEPAHYRSELGERMLASMLGRGCTDMGTAATQPFGMTLRSDTLEAQQTALREALRRRLSGIESATLR